MRNLSRLFFPALMVLVCLSSFAPAAVSAARSQLPDLIPLPAFDVKMKWSDDGQGRALRFSSSVANRSEYAFDLTGTAESTERATAHQCVAWAGPRVCSERAEVGHFVWHPDHGHHHFEDFELYELRKLTPSGAPDMSQGGLVVSGGKISFCLIDYEPDGSTDDPLYSEPYPLYYGCAAGSGTQGISPGWRDTYDWGLMGQQIIVKGIPNGDYAVVITVDPDHRLKEASTSNNVSATRIRLKGNGSRASTLCHYDGISSRCD